LQRVAPLPQTTHPARAARTGSVTAPERTSAHWEFVMKIAIIGAGAIGGYAGAKLALAGEQVTFLVRGANLQAIRRNGITLEENDGRVHVARNVTATDDYAAAGPQDVVVLGMKAHQVEAVLPSLPHLLGPDTVIVPMQNGIPFWYFHRHGGALAGTVVRSVDPQGALLAGIDASRILGCVVYPASELVAPGVVRHIEGERFPIGELDGTSSERAMRVSNAFAKAGLKAPVLDDIRAEMWLKLWGKLGIGFRVSLDKRIAGAEKVGAHKTSMLQDVEAGREPEIDGLVGAVAELGRLTDTPTPHIDAVLALMRLLAHTMKTRAVRVHTEPLDVPAVLPRAAAA
jgi:2-dehydropantoate 2-reductase